jgi:hypothetical protein
LLPADPSVEEKLDIVRFDVDAVTIASGLQGDDFHGGIVPLPAWRGYVVALCESSGPEVKDKLKADVMGRARSIADAAGGILGFNKTAASEQSVIDSLEQTFMEV